MLPKSLRLKRTEFDLSRKGSARATAHFRISHVSGAENGGSAAVVPKKLVKGAVARHLLKRRMRAVLRSWSAKDRILVVSARKGADTLTFQELHDELSGALQAILGEHA